LAALGLVTLGSAGFLAAGAFLMVGATASPDGFFVILAFGTVASSFGIAVAFAMAFVAAGFTVGAEPHDSPSLSSLSAMAVFFLGAAFFCVTGFVTFSLSFYKDAQIGKLHIDGEYQGKLRTISPSVMITPYL
jgi:hypothetical protein